MARTRKIEIQLSGESKDAEKAFDRVGKAAEDARKDIEKVGDADPFGKLEDAGSGFAGKFEDLGSGLGGAFAGAFAAAGVAGAALLAEGLASAMEQEMATDKLAAQLGATGQFAEDLGEIAGDLWVQGFGESMGDVADAIKEVWRGGILPEDATNEQIESMTAQVLTFVDVLDQDLTMSVNAVAQMLRTGLAKDGTEALDILTRGIQQGADKAGDLAETFNEYSTQFRELGLSGAEAAGLMVQGVQAGARNADIVADALKEFAIRAQDGSELTKNAFRDLGLAGDEMTRIFAEGGPPARDALQQVLDRLREVPDPADRSRLAVALFGTQAEDLQNSLNALDPSTAVQTLGTVSGSTDSLGSAYDNAGAKIEAFKRQVLQKLTEFIAAEVIPRIEQLIAWVHRNREAFETIGTVAENFVRGIQKIVASLDWLVGAIRSTIGWVNGLISSIDHALDKAQELVFGNPFTLPKGGKSVPKGGSFDDGGVVPGPVGSPRLILAHGGETILPTHKTGVGGAIYVTNVYVEGSVLDHRGLITAVNEGMSKGYRLQSQGRGL